MRKGRAEDLHAEADAVLSVMFGPTDDFGLEGGGC